jgi:hypothetical protein
MAEKSPNGVPLSKSIHYLSSGLVDTTGAGKWGGVGRGLLRQIKTLLRLFVIFIGLANVEAASAYPIYIYGKLVCRSPRQSNQPAAGLKRGIGEFLFLVTAIDDL